MARSGSFLASKDSLLPVESTSPISHDEAKKAEKALAQQHREANAAQVDLAEVFRKTTAAQLALAEGLTVPLLMDGQGPSTSTTTLPRAAKVWRALLTTWVRHLGAPSLIITDGGKEFQGRFERGLEQLGVLQRVTAPESPWQNSRAERHGGWLKQKMTQELDSGRGIIATKEDLDEFAGVPGAKNRWFNNGGYTPAPIIFGELPRMPGELLSSDESGLQVLSDAFHDPPGMDEAATEFKRRHQIRERAGNWPWKRPAGR